MFIKVSQGEKVRTALVNVSFYSYGAALHVYLATIIITHFCVSLIP